MGDGEEGDGGLSGRKTNMETGFRRNGGDRGKILVVGNRGRRL